MNKTKIWLVVAVLLILIGSIVLGVVMMKLNWDFTALSTTEYETNTTNVDAEYKNISITTDTADIELVFSDESKVVCREQINAKHLVEVKDGTLFVKLSDDRKWYEHVGINFEGSKITVYLSQKDYGTVSVKTATGNVKAEDLTAELVDISVTTGRINLAHIDCKNLTTNGNTGKTILKNVIVAEKLYVTRTTGGVNLDGCDASEIVIKTNTGDVTGTLLTEKVFIAHTDTGRVKVPNTTSGGRCEITTDTGNIKITIAD